jgi:hypothetical protein
VVDTAENDSDTEAPPPRRRQPQRRETRRRAVAPSGAAAGTPTPRIAMHFADSPSPSDSDVVVVDTSVPRSVASRSAPSTAPAVISSDVASSGSVASGAASFTPVLVAPGLTVPTSSVQPVSALLPGTIPSLSSDASPSPLLNMSMTPRDATFAMLPGQQSAANSAPTFHSGQDLMRMAHAFQGSNSICDFLGRSPSPDDVRRWFLLKTQMDMLSRAEQSLRSNMRRRYEQDLEMQEAQMLNSQRDFAMLAVLMMGGR